MSPMKVRADDRVLQECRTLIEEKLGWGSSETWANRDFEALSARIESATHVKLSVATLKRLWGKVKYTSHPTLTTLDALALFMGYENWRTFQVQNQQPDNIQQAAEKRQPLRKKSVLLIPAALGMAILIILLLSNDNLPVGLSHAPIDPGAFSFNSTKVLTEGVPNSVIFNYDASRATDQDSIFIQQSWNTQLRRRVNRTGSHHTSIYYYPGYFRAKLIVNDQIVKEHDLFILSNGWVPVIERSSVPVYIETREAFVGGTMTIGPKTVTTNGIPLQPETPWVAFHNARNFGDMKSDNFIFETELRNEYGEGAGVCRLTEIHIRLEGGALIVPLSIKGCVSNLQFTDKNGRIGDTSALGCDLSTWVTLRYEVRAGKGSIFINDRKAYDMDLGFPALPIAGILYRFQGAGSVNYVRLFETDGTVVYEDNF